MIVHIRLRGFDSPVQGMEWCFDGPFCVGRAPSADLVLSCPSMSWLHATFRPDANGAWWVRDEDSTNGTFLRGLPLDGHEWPIDRGEPIQLGQVVLQVIAVNESWGPSVRVDAAEGPTSSGPHDNGALRPPTVSVPAHAALPPERRSYQLGFTPFTVRRVASVFGDSPHPPRVWLDHAGRILMQSADGRLVLLLEYVSRVALDALDARDRLIELEFGGYLLTLCAFNGRKWTRTRINQHPDLERVLGEAATVWGRTSAFPQS